jgi:hypothetical protein
MPSAYSGLTAYYAILRSGIIRLQNRSSGMQVAPRLASVMKMFTESNQTEDSTQPFDYNVALRRVIYLASFGVVFIFIYSLGVARSLCGDFGSVFSVGLMAAGAAIVSGGLLGFLFGVPHTREDETASSKGGRPESTTEQEVKSGTTDTSTSYRPNTSLEQISDWLTKMLVGVGLIEIKVIPEKLKGIARYVATGLGDNDQARAFALSLLIFFSVCGFVFGFLWARLYLKRWFTEADQVRILGKKLDQLEMDARALALITRQLTSGKGDPPTDPKLIAEAIKTASPAVRAQIFAQAEAAADREGDEDYQIKLKAAIPIFKALIANDPKELYDRNHQELSQALQRQESPDLEEAVKEITKAIEIRDRLGKSGWQFYEFLRAVQRIKQDRNYKSGQASDRALVTQIVNDLKVASTDTERWPAWSDDPNVVKWMKLNSIDVATLESP